jgi:hypothetical protein
MVIGWCIQKRGRIWIGGWSGLGPYGLDSAYLYVHFDVHDRVIATEITGG